jgi:ABC-type sugar transport system ATPase subunit
LALLNASAVSKLYPGTTALSGVDLEVDSGEVHALLGENGAGKSTLMKVIAGAETADAGKVVVEGTVVQPGSLESARAHGIAIVYQELSLVPSLSVGENVLLGRWPTSRWGLIDWSALFQEARRFLDTIGFDIDPKGRLDRLGMAERQLVEIAKALATGRVKLLLLDEPTSALSDREAARLFELIDDLKARGVAIVYVSHRLKEILRIADRVTVLRDGKRVDTVASEGIGEARLAMMMVGREVRDAEGVRTSVASTGRRDVVLRATNLSRAPRLKQVDLKLHRGEVVGIFGLVGAGRTRLARTIFGLEPPLGGSLEIEDKRGTIDSPATAIELGLGYLGEDRSLGLVPRMSVAQNVTLAALSSMPGPLLDFAKEAEIAQRYVDELAIRVSSVHQLVETLSGGNQQKVLLARCLCSHARILILDDPTRGIDVGAKEEVFRLVRKLAGDGVAILYLTSEIKEARSMSERLLVMANGRVIREMNPDTPEDEIMAAAGGAHG